MNGNAKEIWVSFSESFVSKINEETIPTVILTTSSPKCSCYISEQNNKGFNILIENYNGEEILINWIAMAKTSENNKPDNTKNIDPALLRQLKVSESIKEEIKENSQHTQNEPMKLLEPQTTMPNSKRLTP